MTVNEVIDEIKGSRKQVSSSQRDEVRVMQGMLNDLEYEVGVYSKEGKIDTYNPAKDFRSMQTNIISQVAKIDKSEAESLVAGYEVTKSDASSMVSVSKEFINTYLQCGRKLPLGGRELSNASLIAKEIPSAEKIFQRKCTDESGNITWEPGKKIVPMHVGVKSKSPCPEWVK